MRVLVIGDDTRSFLAVVRSLGRKGHEVHAAPFDFSSPALASRYLAGVHRLPPYSLSPDGWVEAMSRLIEGFDLVIPCDDRSLVPLDRHADAFGRERLALPNPEAMAVFFDKAETRRVAAAAGVPIAPGRLLAEGDDARSLLAEFGAPLALKPRSSYTLGQSGPRSSVRIVRRAADLATVLQRIEDRSRWLVEGFFAGVGIGVSVLARGGEVLLAFQHRRLEEASETGGSSSRISEAVEPPLLAAVKALAGATRLHGVAMFEFRQSPKSGAFILLEVNARFWGSLPLAVAAGADFPALLAELHLSGTATPPPAYRLGLKRRGLTGEYYRILKEAEAIRGRPRQFLRLAAGLGMLGGRVLTGASFDSYAPDDKRPWHAERLSLVQLVVRAAAKRIPLAGWRRRRGRRGARTISQALRRGPAKVIMLCHGNICRSPFAEQLLKAKAQDAGLALEIVSAGTIALEGRQSPAEAIAAARSYGADLDRHRSACLTPAELAAADAVIVFDEKNVDELLRFGANGSVNLLRLADLTGEREIPDPYGHGASGFAEVYGQIDRALSALVMELAQAGARR